jgi:hypothetical protein
MGPVAETARSAARARAIAFLAAIEDGCAESLPACPGGHAVLDGRHPALRAVGEHALRAARAGGAELVFAIADAEDWPQGFYRRAGFAGTGLPPRFLRTAPRTSP